MIDKKKAESIEALGFGKIAQSLSDNFEQHQSILEKFSQQAEDGELDPLKLQEPFSHLSLALSQNPAKLAEANVKFFSDSMKLYQNMSENFLGMMMPGESNSENARKTQ